MRRLRLCRRHCSFVPGDHSVDQSWAIMCLFQHTAERIKDILVPIWLLFFGRSLFTGVSYVAPSRSWVPCHGLPSCYVDSSRIPKRSLKVSRRSTWTSRIRLFANHTSLIMFLVLLSRCNGKHLFGGLHYISDLMLGIFNIDIHYTQGHSHPSFTTSGSKGGYFTWLDGASRHQTVSCCVYLLLLSDCKFLGFRLCL